MAAPANQNIHQSDKSNKPTSPKSWLDHNNKNYKAWARESKKSSIYVKCIYIKMIFWLSHVMECILTKRLKFT